MIVLIEGLHQMMHVVIAHLLEAPTNLRERKMLSLKVLHQPKPVEMRLIVPWPRPMPRRRQETLLDIVPDRPDGDACPRTELLQIPRVLRRHDRYYNTDTSQ